MYKLFYEAKDGSSSGEATPVATEAEAVKICKWHNFHYPRFRHTYEESSDQWHDLPSHE